MTKTNVIAGIILIAMTSVASCKKNGTENINNNGIKPPTQSEFNQVRKDALNDITQTATFKAENGFTFTSAKGATLTFLPNAFASNGNPVTGNVTLEFVELYKRGDMLAVNKPLMGTALNGITKGALITGGQFFIKVTQNGNQLTGRYQLNVSTENTGTADPNMVLWKGTEDANGNLTWDEMAPENDSTNEVFLAKRDNGGAPLYSYLGDVFGWTNIDILAGLPDPKAQVWAKAPAGYDDKNCSIYVVYKNQPGSLALMDSWDDTKKMFTEHYGLAPIGYNFYMVFVSTQTNGKYVYAVKNVTVAANMVTTFEQADLQTIDKADLITLINNLQ
jgi:hypothetical protein